MVGKYDRIMTRKDKLASKKSQLVFLHKLNYDIIFTSSSHLETVPTVDISVIFCVLYRLFLIQYSLSTANVLLCKQMRYINSINQIKPAYRSVSSISCEHYLTQKKSYVPIGRFSWNTCKLAPRLIREEKCIQHIIIKNNNSTIKLHLYTFILLLMYPAKNL